ncbi:MAG: hypothetical protein R8M38_08690 [Mariprofundaceae bacterium]
MMKVVFEGGAEQLQVQQYSFAAHNCNKHLDLKSHLPIAAHEFCK